MNNVIIFLGTSAFVWGIYAVFRPGMILSHLGMLITQYFPEWLRKPLIGCPACMSFWYGMVAFWLLEGVPKNPASLFLWCIMLVGFNYYIGQLMYSDE